MTNKQDAAVKPIQPYKTTCEGDLLIAGDETGTNGKVDFEQAISACGYGKFHYILMLAMIPACCAQVYSSMTMAYVLPTAECELKLTDNNKGALNAATFIGLSLGSFCGGFASDVFGRRKLIILGNAVAFVCNVIASFAHSFWLLLLMKIGSGFSMAGPVASLTSYCAETHNNEKRPRVIMMSGGFSALAQGIQPAMAYYLIPLDFRIELIPGEMDFTSWRLFLLLSAFPNLLAAIVFAFFPESPKFLLNKGRMEKALESFRCIYVANTGKPAHTFQISNLQVSAGHTKPKPPILFITVIKNSLKQISPMFRPPYLNTALIVFCISACTMIGMNTVRLWVPQLFATLNEAKALNITGVTTVCGMIGRVVEAVPMESKLPKDGQVCQTINGDVYLRSFVISGTSAVSFIITIPVVGWIGKKNLAKLCFPAAAAVAIAINWATNTDLFTALLAVYTALTRNAFSVVTTITVDLFPTAFRSTAVSMVSLCGRIASMIGNLVFPILLNLGCSVTLFSIGGILLLASSLVWLVSNKTEEI